MPYLFKNKYRIPPARLQSWDYADNGMYFITICTANKECFFGEIVEDAAVVETRCIASLPQPNPKMQKMRLNFLGEVVEKEWLKTPSLRPDMNLMLDEYVVMPNHFHDIIYIGENQYNAENHYGLRNGRDAMHRVSTTMDIDPGKNKFGPQQKNLASIIRGFKSAVTILARKNILPFNWQARFHDHIITSNAEYFRIVNYIKNNPDKWYEDKFYSK